ncbi:MAG: YitT family protein [Ruminococcus sp.]|nr:YitT family protein [Ruminococcus sp.]
MRCFKKHLIFETVPYKTLNERGYILKKIIEALREIPPLHFIMLTVAGIINAFGITIFLMPVKLYDSGISGTSMFLAQHSPEWLSLSVFLIILNVPLFLYGMKKQGISFTICAVYTVIIYSVASWLITDVLPIDVSLASPLAGTDLLLCAVFGGVISGMGSGLAIRYGGAMDGIEVMAVIFAKKLGLSVGSFVMIYNVILYIICGIAINSWILPLYSIVTYAAALKTVDFIVDGLQRSKAAMIVTSKPDKISSRLMNEFGCGVTIIQAKGGFSGTDRSILYFVVNRFQVMKVKDIVHKVDPLAYITLTEVADIFSANHNN